MSNRPGYYKGCLELNGFKSTFIVYAANGEHAAKKAVEEAPVDMEGAKVWEIDGPYQNVQL